MKRVDLVIIAIAAGFVIFIGVGYLLNPSFVYDNFIWKYYWGPVVADALDHPVEYHGIVAREGYTLVSEITYGILAIIGIYYIYRLFRRLEITVDWNFCIALIPIILFGPFSRVLEDMQYFKIPTTYWFISPLIYIQITVYTLIFIIAGWYIEKKSKKQILSIILGLETLILLFFWSFSEAIAYTLSPFIIFAGAAFAFLPVILDVYQSKRVRKDTVILSSGILILFPAIGAIGEWIARNHGVIRGDVFLVTVAISSIITFLVWGIAKLSKKAKPYTQPLNLAMIFGHMIDGLTTYISIYDPLGMGIPLYGEKHPIPFSLMELSGGILFPVVKFVLIVTIIYLMDIAYKKELSKHGNLVNLLKICIFILGIAPGTRDLLRVSLSV